MKIEYSRGTTSDYENIVDFANYVFSYDCGKLDFPHLLPKLYGRQAGAESFHYLAKAEGRILGMLVSYPMTASILGEEFRVSGIGTVCVHPYRRGLGLMKHLMELALDDMRREGVSFSMLGGQRQRYEYFGYEPCGTKMDFTVTRANIRHARLEPEGGIVFSLMRRDDAGALGRALELQRGLPFHVGRTAENFHDVCLSWRSKPYIIERDNEFLGYAVLSEDQTSFSEIELLKNGLIPNVLAEALACFGTETVHLHLAAYDREKIRALEQFCNGFSIFPACNFRIFDYEHVLGKLLQLKASYVPLADGALTLEIKDKARLRMEVRGRRATVARTEAPPDLTLPPLAAMRFLFSPLTSSVEYESCRGIASWFPLPLFWPEADGV